MQYSDQITIFMSPGLNISSNKYNRRVQEIISLKTCLYKQLLLSDVQENSRQTTCNAASYFKITDRLQFLSNHLLEKPWELEDCYDGAWASASVTRLQTVEEDEWMY